MTYEARIISGTGKATIMHARRGEALEAHCGVPLVPGSLNLSLDRPFDWTGSERTVIPDAVSWDDLEGPWTTGRASIREVRVDGHRAWAFRLARSRAPEAFCEVVAPVRIRDVLSGDTCVLEVP